MASFDLRGEPWIPVASMHGPAREVGLRDILTEADTLRDLASASPLENVAILSLLIAILYDWRKPEGEDEFEDGWKRLWQAGKFPVREIEEYFALRKDRFDLFHEERPFYQTPRLVVDRVDPVTRLSTEVASGNNATLFDHRVDSTPEPLTPAEAARALLVAQAFALGFGKAATARIDGVEHARPYSADAILLRGLTVWLSGDTLFETLLLNYSNYARNPNDAAAWDVDPPHALMDRVEGGARVTTGVRGRLDRLTWQSRLVLLLPEIDGDGQTVVRHMYFTQGRSADKADHPLKTYRKDDKLGLLPVSLSPSKAAWRDAHSLFQLSRKSGNQPAAALEWASRLKRLGPLLQRHVLGFNVVGLATAPNKAGKFLMWRQERMPLPTALLGDEQDTLLGVIRDALAYADDQANRMRDRMARVVKLYLAPDLDKKGGRQPDSGEVARLVDSVDPRRAYWPRLEAPFHRLLQGLAADPSAATTAWMEAVAQQRRRAQDEAIKALGTHQRVQVAVAREAAERKRYAEHKQRERNALGGATK